MSFRLICESMHGIFQNLQLMMEVETRILTRSHLGFLCSILSAFPALLLPCPWCLSLAMQTFYQPLILLDSLHIPRPLHVLLTPFLLYLVKFLTQQTPTSVRRTYAWQVCITFLHSTPFLVIVNSWVRSILDASQWPMWYQGEPLSLFLLFIIPQCLGQGAPSADVC